MSSIRSTSGSSAARNCRHEGAVRYLPWLPVRMCGPKGTDLGGRVLRAAQTRFDSRQPSRERFDDFIRSCSALRLLLLQVAQSSAAIHRPPKGGGRGCDDLKLPAVEHLRVVASAAHLDLPD